MRNDLSLHKGTSARRAKLRLQSGNGVENIDFQRLYRTFSMCRRQLHDVITNYYFAFAKIFLQSVLRYDIIISIDTFGVQLYGDQLQKTLETAY